MKLIPGAEISNDFIDIMKPMGHTMRTYLIAKDRTQYGKFFISMAAVIAFIVFMGFARTFYLRTAFTNKPLTPLLRFHGIVFTSWIALLLVQTSLVAAKRTDIHRRLGAAGMALAGLMVVVGPIVAIHAAKTGHGPLESRLTSLVIPFGDVVVFAALVTAAFFYRTNPQTHKRLVLLATIGILPPAMARLPLAFIQALGPWGFFGLADLVLLSCLAWDLITQERVHRAYLWGGLLIVASQPLRLLIGGTSGWILIARWLTQ